MNSGLSLEWQVRMLPLNWLLLDPDLLLLDLHLLVLILAMNRLFFNRRRSSRHHPGH